MHLGDHRYDPSKLGSAWPLQLALATILGTPATACMNPFAEPPRMFGSQPALRFA